MLCDMELSSGDIFVCQNLGTQSHMAGESTPGGVQEIFPHSL